MNAVLSKISRVFVWADMRKCEERGELLLPVLFFLLVVLSVLLYYAVSLMDPGFVLTDTVQVRLTDKAKHTESYVKVSEHVLIDNLIHYCTKEVMSEVIWMFFSWVSSLKVQSSQSVYKTPLCQWEGVVVNRICSDVFSPFNQGHSGWRQSMCVCTRDPHQSMLCRVQMKKWNRWSSVRPLGCGAADTACCR